jgi:hypothetical protein
LVPALVFSTDGAAMCALLFTLAVTNNLS